MRGVASHQEGSGKSSGDQDHTCHETYEVVSGTQDLPPFFALPALVNGIGLRQRACYVRRSYRPGAAQLASSTSQEKSGQDRPARISGQSPDCRVPRCTVAVCRDFDSHCISCLAVTSGGLAPRSRWLAGLRLRVQTTKPKVHCLPHTGAWDGSLTHALSTDLIESHIHAFCERALCMLLSRHLIQNTGVSCASSGGQSQSNQDPTAGLCGRLEAKISGPFRIARARGNCGPRYADCSAQSSCCDLMPGRPWIAVADTLFVLCRHVYDGYSVGARSAYRKA